MTHKTTPYETARSLAILFSSLQNARSDALKDVTEAAGRLLSDTAASLSASEAPDISGAPKEIEIRITNLSRAYDTMETIGLDCHHVLVREIADIIDVNMNIMAAQDASRIFFLLPFDIQENILCDVDYDAPRNKILRTLLDRAAGAFPTKKTMPQSLLFLSQEAIEKLVSLGLPYNSLVASQSVPLWITRGAVFGKDAFRKKYPRKDPMVAYWEENGFVLPKSPLCPDGVDLVLKSIETIGKHTTSAMLKKCLAVPSDIRLHIAFRLAGKHPPAQIPAFSRQNRKDRAFAERCSGLFRTHETHHKTLEYVRLRQKLPAPRQVLSMTQKDLMAHIDKIFDEVSHVIDV